MLERLPRRHAGTFGVGRVEADQAEVAQSVDPGELVAPRACEPHGLEQRSLGFRQLAAVVESDAEDAVGDRQAERTHHRRICQRLARDLLGMGELAELEAEDRVEDDALGHGRGID